MLIDTRTLNAGQLAELQKLQKLIPGLVPSAPNPSSAVAAGAANSLAGSSSALQFPSALRPGSTAVPGTAATAAAAAAAAAILAPARTAAAAPPGGGLATAPGSQFNYQAYLQQQQETRARQKAERARKKAEKKARDKAAVDRALLAAGALPGQQLPGAAAGAATAAAGAGGEEETEEADAPDGSDEQEDGHTYAAYEATQIREIYPGIMGHPDPLVETASLASIPLPKPTWRPAPCLEECVEQKLLSDAQLETVIYAYTKFHGQLLHDGKRAGFFLGDGAGVGKGRQIAAMVKQHWAEGGRRAMWVSVSNDLRKDAERDLVDINSKEIHCFPRGNENLPPAKKPLNFSGVLFVTYSMLVSGLNIGKSKKPKEEKKKDEKLERIVVPVGSRLKQFIDWLSGEEAPLIIFDECHKAKNLMPVGGHASQTALAVVELQEALPSAKILYSSATGASEPRNLAYMTRLGMWGFKNAKDVIEMLNKSRLGALELAAMSMKATGCYLSRTLSYEGAEFAVVHVEVDPEFQIMYNRASQFWNLLYKVIDQLGVKGKVKSQFWGSHQRFFKQMLMAAKVPACANEAKRAIQEGHCVVVGLQSTGEANTNAMLDEGDDLNDLVSAPRMVLMQYLQNHFPIEVGKESTAEMEEVERQVWEAIESWRSMKPAAEVVSAGEAGMLAERMQEMRRAGIDVGSNAGYLPEEEINRRRLEMRLAQRKAAEEEQARLREEKNRRWYEEREKRRDELQAELAETEDEVRELEGKLQGILKQAEQEEEASAAKASAKKEPVAGSGGRLAAKKGAAAAGAGAASKQRSSAMDWSEDGSSDDDILLAQLSGRKSASKKRVLADLEDSEDSPPPKKGPAAKRGPVVLDDSSDEESDEEMGGVAPGRRPLSARNTNAQQAQQGAGSKAPAAKRQVPHVDLTTEDDDDIVCAVCGSGDSADTLMLCDKCDSGAHAHCIGLSCLPEGPWFCSGCSKSSSKAQPRQPAKQVSYVDLSSEEEDTVMSPPPKRPTRQQQQQQQRNTKQQPIQAFVVRGSLGVKKLRTERGLKEAHSRLDSLLSELDAVQQELEAGPAVSPAKAKSRRGISTRSGKTFDPTVRTMEIKDSHIEGFKYAVKNDRSGLESLTRDAHMDIGGLPPSSAAARPGSAAKGKGTGSAANGKGKAKAGYESGSDYEADGDDDLVDELPSDFEDERDLFSDGDGPRTCRELIRIRQWLLRLVNAMELPANPLDQLIDLVGGEDKVAELTGRKGSVTRDEGGGASYKQRKTEGSFKDINLHEKEAFMSGRKLVAIISDAASTGISLQADRRVNNKKRRVHITLELPWSADKAIQQFGRSHRANQVSSPLYRILVTPCGGEYRFASAAAKRLQSLGALLKGDRNATGAGVELKEFDIDNPVGEQALQRVLSDILCETEAMPGVKVPDLPDDFVMPDKVYKARVDYPGRHIAPFYQYMRSKMAGVGLFDITEVNGETIVFPVRGGQKVKVTKFLNRLLGMTTCDQKLLFDYYHATLDATISQLKSEGRYEQGIVTIKGNSCQLVSKQLIYTDEQTGGKVEHAKLDLDRGLTWEKMVEFRDSVMERLEELEPRRRHYSGFYQQINGHQVMAGGKRRPYIILATEIIKSAQNLRNTKMYIQRPNVGAQGSMTLQELQAKGYKVMKDEDAEELWRFWFDYTEEHCYHGDNCRARRSGYGCTAGTRKITSDLLTGAVLPIWMRLEQLHKHSQYGVTTKTGKRPLRVVKVITTDEQPVVGVEVPGGDAEVKYFLQNLQPEEAKPQAQQNAAAAAAAAASMYAAAGIGTHGGGRGRGRGPRAYGMI